MSKIKKTKLTIRHEGLTASTKFNSVDTSIDDIIEGFTNLLIQVGFTPSLISDYFKEFNK